MMHRTRTDFWARRGIQPLEPKLIGYRCPCWGSVSTTSQFVCPICKQPINIEVKKP